MSWAKVKLVWLREIRDQIRDRRTIFTVAVLPILLYPLMGMVVLQVSQFKGEQSTRVLVIGEEELPDEPPLIINTGGQWRLYDGQTAEPAGEAADDSLPDAVDDEEM